MLHLVQTHYSPRLWDSGFKDLLISGLLKTDPNHHKAIEILQYLLRNNPIDSCYNLKKEDLFLQNILEAPDLRNL